MRSEEDADKLSTYLQHPPAQGRRGYPLPAVLLEMTMRSISHPDLPDLDSAECRLNPGYIAESRLKTNLRVTGKIRCRLA